MCRSVQARLVAIRNKLRAQKVATTLNYGALTRPDLTPSAEISSVINPNDSVLDRLLYARFLARFTRTDGVKLTPFVDFAFSFEVDPSLREQNEALGSTITGRDVEAWYDNCISGHVVETGSNYVVYAIDVDNNWYVLTENQTATINLQVEAISPVPGEISLVRYYE